MLLLLKTEADCLDQQHRRISESAAQRTTETAPERSPRMAVFLTIGRYLDRPLAGHRARPAAATCAKNQNEFESGTTWPRGRRSSLAAGRSQRPMDSLAVFPSRVRWDEFLGRIRGNWGSSSRLGRGAWTLGTDRDRTTHGCRAGDASRSRRFRSSGRHWPRCQAWLLRGWSNSYARRCCLP